MIFGKAALGSKYVGFPECAEEAVPPGNVAVIEGVEIALMMNRMMLRPLQEVTPPMRRA
jgi:hypothetical protein